MKYILRQIIWPCFLVYIGFIALLYFLQNTFVYAPPALSQIDLSKLSEFTHQEVTTSDGLKIKGYYLAPQKGFPLILEFHGNGSHPAWEYPKFQELAKKGYGIFLAEYRGYGGNQGKPSENNLYLDGVAYVEWIKSNAELKASKIVIYGSSIGSGVAVDAAKQVPDLAALILEVPFDRLSYVAAWHYPYIPFIEAMMKNKFPNDEKIKDIKAPALFMLAGEDKIVPMQFGRRLADMANQPKEAFVLEKASHIDIYNYGAATLVDSFLKEHVHD